jgi:hypothetical protein
MEKQELTSTEIMVGLVVLAGVPIVIFSNYNPMLAIGFLVTVMLAFAVGGILEARSDD